MKDQECPACGAEVGEGVLHKEPLPYTAGVNDPPLRLRSFATESAASEFISTLEGHDDGRFYLDGPEYGRECCAGAEPCDKHATRGEHAYTSASTPTGRITYVGIQH